MHIPPFAIVGFVCGHHLHLGGLEDIAIGGLTEYAFQAAAEEMGGIGQAAIAQEDALLSALEPRQCLFLKGWGDQHFVKLCVDLLSKCEVDGAVADQYASKGRDDWCV